MIWLTVRNIRRAAGPWVDIIKAGLVLDSIGLMFSHSFQRKLGDGSTIKIWSDQWLEAEKLCVLFHGLFALEQDKECTVQDRVAFHWNWRQNPRGRETSELHSILRLLSTVALDHQRSDPWSSSFAENGIFSVKEVAAQLDSTWAFPSNTLTIRIRYLPQKVNIFLWRARRNLLPTYMNLALRGINVDSIICPLCSIDIKSTRACVVALPKDILGLGFSGSMVWDLRALFMGGNRFIFYGNFKPSSTR